MAVVVRHVAAPALFAGVLSSLVALPRVAEATQVTFELRHTPMRVRPSDSPSLCGILALSLAEHWWVGAGYELVQDYDAVLWSSHSFGRKPIVMSGIRAGTWYRGDVLGGGISYSLGGLFTLANHAFSIDSSPQGLDDATYVVDFGLDMTLGHTWRAIRIEAFATPAWSYGRVRSTGIDRDDRYSAFTYRIGGALAIPLGRANRPASAEEQPE